jgi:phosphinothricin acetyltransferase
MAAVAAIVNHYIEAGVAHFGDRPQTAQDWLADWSAHEERYPWLVAERDGGIGGLAYAKRFNPRAAYDWTAEVSIYLHPDALGQGLGSAMYERLLALLDAQGFRCLVAGITTPNEASVRLHERFGFRHLGTLERVGYKHGRWRDVGSWQRHVGPADDSEPAPVRLVSEVDH